MTAISAAANLDAICRRHDLPLPKAYTDAHAALTARYDLGRLDPLPRLADAVAAALEAGRDPYADETVRYVLARRDATPAVEAALRDARENATAALLADHAAAIVAAWRDRWTELGKAVSAAAARLPGVDLGKPQSIALAGTGETAHLWVTAHAAATELEGIASAVALLIAQGRRDEWCHVGAVLTPDQHVRIARDGRGGVAWAGALLGVELDLCTSAAELHARAAHVRAERERLANLEPKRPSYLMHT